MRTSTLMMSIGIVLLAACGGSADDGANDAGEAGAAAAGVSMADVTEPMELTEKDVEQFVAILTEMKELGERYTDDGDLSNVGAAIMANAKAHAIVRKHGYADLVRFQRVAYNISAAMAANELGESADLAADRTQLESLKSQMPKDQYDMMVKAHEQMAGMMKGQSAGNKELVARWADRIDAISQ